MVREGGFEPPSPCGRQVLSLVRLPIPPLPRTYLGRRTLQAYLMVFCPFPAEAAIRAVSDPLTLRASAVHGTPFLTTTCRAVEVGVEDVELLLYLGTKIPIRDIPKGFM
jgi:hypothetical protein